MNYKKIKEAEFLSRPNRFLAKVQMDGTTETVHVKNTGRLRELLYDGARIYLEDHGEDRGMRKTRFSLVTVEKRSQPPHTSRLINIDSHAPNRVVGEALTEGRIALPGLSPNLSVIKPEAVYKASRFDFYIEDDKGNKAFLEVKGVTLEDEGVARFPDAPTERGVKHIMELCHAAEHGFKAYVIFVIQMKGIICFMPNDATHPAFGDALRFAAAQGVEILAFDCEVTAESMRLRTEVKVSL
ncbi:DNA/RNA nuclease SfsA [Anoxybacterium hadale]|uniref:DNA/RNA nuclease SfsA n=1 Tax=Anoxybacterium hadale TaxID=3408580 RepID=A0ACD1AAU6_9FIRM|nr:DNA/RNA nuclease SfsA [Clostridiales bacterium]